MPEVILELVRGKQGGQEVGSAHGAPARLIKADIQVTVAEKLVANC
jgi:hypothetical protein